jgi:hypothetical protein
VTAPIAGPPSGGQQPMWTEGPVHPGLRCQICGLSPAAGVTFRAHRGYVVAMSFRKVPGPLCRLCGIAVFRAATAETLALGWWSGFSLFFFGWYTIAANLIARRKVLRLPEPFPLPAHPLLPPGPPIYRRPLVYIALFPVAWVVLAVIGMIFTS